MPLPLGGRSRRLRCGRWWLSWRTYSSRTRSRWRRPQISIQSRHSCRTVRTQRSANALAFGACTGVVMICAPSAGSTSSKARVNLANQEPRRGCVLRPLQQAFPCPLDHPWSIPMACDTGEANLPRPQFDQEQHLQRGEAHGLHGEEVRGEDARGLHPQNPRRVTDARRGAGRSPLPSRTVRMVVADTPTSRFLSSPWMRRYPSEGSPGPAAGSALPGARPAVDGRLEGRVGSPCG
jgi:hypothetical protein